MRKQGEKFRPLDTTTSVHDQFFKLFFNTPKNLSVLTIFSLRATERVFFDFDSLTICNDTFIDAEHLGSSEADIVSLTKLVDSGLPVAIVIEAKSNPDNKTMVKIFKYLYHLLNQETAAAVIVIMVYHGRKRWKRQKRYAAFKYAELGESFVESFADILVDFGVRFIDLRNEEVYRSLYELPLEVQLPLRFLADIWEANEHTYLELVHQSQPLTGKERERLLKAAASYLMAVHGSITIESISREMQTQNLGDEVMETISEEWEIIKPFLIKQGVEKGIEQGIEQGIEKGIEQGIEQGIDKGIEQGIERVAERMIHKSYSDSEISGLTGLDAKHIEKLRNGR